MEIIHKSIIKTFCLLLILSSCTPSVNQRISDADRILINSPFKKVLVRSGNFVLTTYQKISDIDSPYIFYIDGDGFVRRNIETISENPTPINPIVIRLASLDPRNNIIYLARPCQYTDLSLNSLCRNNKYWTESRMSEEIVEVITNAIKQIANNHQISLVGFSGGGGIAILVSPRLKNIKDITTIAGNLDIAEFCKFHNYPAIKDSLNPIDFIGQVRNIPQLHISGGKDKVVPEIITDKFVKASNSKCVKKMSIESATHGKGWDLIWTELIKQKISCD
jgi:hypothetical protein